MGEWIEIKKMIRVLQGGLFLQDDSEKDKPWT